MAPMEAAFYECLQREYVLVRQDEHLFQDIMPRSAVYTELVQEFGPRIRNFPQSPQLFWSEFKKCLACKDGESLLIECCHGRRVRLRDDGGAGGDAGGRGGDGVGDGSNGGGGGCNGGGEGGGSSGDSGGDWGNIGDGTAAARFI